MGLLDLIRRGRYVADTVPDRCFAGRPKHEPCRGCEQDCRRRRASRRAVRDFLDQVDRRTSDELATLMRERPEPKGSLKADALLAGVAEHLAAVRHLQCEDWMTEPGRFLDRFWFVSSVPGFRAVALAQTPIALKRRGVFWPARSMEQV
jgi:hypothetical protein